jgi:hypothetical protein
MLSMISTKALKNKQKLVESTFVRILEKSKGYSNQGNIFIATKIPLYALAITFLPFLLP